MDEKANILIVDDVPQKRLALEAILEGLGQNLVQAISGLDALRKLLVQDFAVILLDVNMPEMDGFETARLIRQRKRTEHTPIIFVTGISDEMLAAQGYALGAVDYILAPVVPEVLRTKVSVFVELYRHGQVLRRQAEERVALAREQAARAAAESANRRLAFLADASNVLNNSLDYRETQSDLLRLVVPTLAEFAVLTMADAPPPGHSDWAWAKPGGELHTRTVNATDAGYDVLRSARERVLTTGGVELLEPLDLPYPPGEPVSRLRCAAILPLRARGHTLGVLTLGRAVGCGDPTDLDLLEEFALRAAIALDNSRLYRDIQETDRRKSEFLALLGHELRNPLAPIRSTVELLRELNLDQPELCKARDTIDRQVQLMVRLVDDLLDVSRITSGKIRLKREPVDFAGIAEQAVEIARPLLDTRRHEFTLTLPDGPLWVDGDPARLAQVMANLLNNAARYTEPGGQVRLTVEAGPKELVARVSDTGIGLNPELLPRLFELFTQAERSTGRDQGGLGVGLALVRRLVEMHGGRVEASSAGTGRGSEFVVTLPRLTDLPKRIPIVQKNGHAKVRRPRRVLVVDDNRDGAESLAHLLRMKGHEVHVAHDGVEALKAAGSIRPEVVVLDIGLPGMDGYEVARRLRRTPDVASARIVALTGYGQDEDRRRSREAGFDHHLVKPVDPSVLDELLSAELKV